MVCIEDMTVYLLAFLKSLINICSPHPCRFNLIWVYSAVYPVDCIKKWGTSLWSMHSCIASSWSVLLKTFFAMSCTSYITSLLLHGFLLSVPKQPGYYNDIVHIWSSWHVAKTILTVVGGQGQHSLVCWPNYSRKCIALMQLCKNWHWQKRLLFFFQTAMGSQLPSCVVFVNRLVASGW